MTPVGVTYQQEISWSDDAGLGPNQYRIRIVYDAGQGFGCPARAPALAALVAAICAPAAAAAGGGVEVQPYRIEAVAARGSLPAPRGA